MDKQQLIFRINGLVRAIENTSGLDEFSLTARSILSFIGEFGTAPTVYARLAELEKGGWIESVPDPQDGRAKQVSLTAQARRVFAKMSKEAQKIIA